MLAGVLSFSYSSVVVTAVAAAVAVVVMGVVCCYRDLSVVARQPFISEIYITMYQGIGLQK